MASCFSVTIEGSARPACTVGLYPINSVAGTNNQHSITLGTVVTGSTVAFTSRTLTTNSIHVSTSGDFNLPANGNYALGVNLGGNQVNNSFVGVSAVLRVRNI